jgi:hypothetical protein
LIEGMTMRLGSAGVGVGEGVCVAVGVGGMGEGVGVCVDVLVGAARVNVADGVMDGWGGIAEVWVDEGTANRELTYG